MYIFIYIYIYGEKERLYICIHEWNICTHILKLQKRNQFWPPSMEVTFNSLPNLNEGWIGPLCGERLPHVDREASGSCGDRAGGVPKHISRWLLILFWRCGLCSFVYICIYIYIYLCMYSIYRDISHVHRIWTVINSLLPSTALEVYWNFLVWRRLSKGPRRGVWI